MILGLQQQLKYDGFEVSLVKLCRWFEVPRRTVYYAPTKAQPKLQERFVTPIKAMIEENPSFGYRTVAHLLGINKTRCKGCFSARAGRCASAPSDFVRASRPYLR